MLPKKDFYQIFPSVVAADKKTAMTISALEKAHMFPDGEEYTLTVKSVNSDEESFYYQTPNNHVFTLKAEGGVLRFDYSFEGEQEHLIILEYAEKVVERFVIYSLFDDLYGVVPVKGDFHSHSCRSDGQRDPSSLAGYYREQGYDCFALTDHNRFYPGGEIDESFSGVETGFIRVPGEEVHAPTSTVHIVRIGGDRSVCEMYCKNTEQYEKEIAEYTERVPSEIPQNYVDRYARAMWATDKIHETGGIAIFPHPYWRPKNLVYNECDEFAMILLKSGMFDAYELVGGMKQPDQNRSLALWGDLRASGYDIPVVGSSDVHSIDRSELFPFNFTIVFAKAKSVDAIVEAIKSGRSVAVESNGSDEYARQHRIYGKLRYVSYARFLIEYFYPKFERFCQGEGVAMRSYAMGDAPKESIELQAKLAEKFRLRFFGEIAAFAPSKEVLDFEDKWRAIQAEGPVTKGSSIYPKK